MERTKSGTKEIAPKIEINAKQLQVLSEIVSRAEFASKMGISFNGQRDLYEVFGYKRDIAFADNYAKWQRQDIAKAIIDRPIKTTWRGPVRLLETKDAEDTPFEKAWETLYDRLKLKSNFVRVDKLTGLGRYGLLLLGFSDVSSPEVWKKEAPAKVTLVYVKCFSEQTAIVAEYETDPKNPRYGQPKFYSLTIKNDISQSAIIVHYSRVLHITEDSMDGIEGTPRLEAVFNRLDDLEKLVGGSAEMYWKGARPGYQAKIDPDFTLGATAEAALHTQIDEYEHNLRRILTNQGIDLKELGGQISDPKSHVEIQLMMISAVTNIPKRILIGSEMGELASSEDNQQWLTFIQSRREEFAEPEIIRPFVDMCIEKGILPKPATGKYDIAWMDLFSPSDKEKSDVGRIRAAALKDYAGVPGVDQIMPPDAFFEFFLGLNQDQIELINEMRQANVLDGTNGELTDEEQVVLDEEQAAQDAIDAQIFKDAQNKDKANPTRTR